MSDDAYCCGNYLRHWHVYYCYAADGTLLYVGQSHQTTWRLYHHGQWTGSAWFYYATTVTVSPPLATSAAARQLERAEIARLRPVFNKHHNQSPTPWVLPALPSRRYGSSPEITWLDAVAVLA